MVDDDPTKLAELQKSHGELLGFTEEKTNYKKRDINVKDIDTINKHLAVSREAEHGQVEDKPITAETVDVGVEKRIVRRYGCLLYTSPSPRDQRGSRMPSSA